MTSDPSELIQAAIVAISERKLSLAEKTLNKIISKMPKHASANMLLGELAEQQHKINDAVAYYKASIESTPSNVDGWVKMVTLLIKIKKHKNARDILEQAITFNGENEQFTRLQEILTTGIEQNNSATDSKNNDLLKRSEFLFRSGRHGEIIELLNRSDHSTWKEPDKLFFILAAAYAASGKAKLAIKAYEKVLTLNENNKGVWNNLGLIYYQLGHKDKAINCYKIAISMDGMYAAAHNNLGLAYKDSKIWGSAIKHFGQAIKSNQNYAEAMNNLGSVYYETGDFQRALEYFDAAIKNKMNYSDAYCNKGNALRQKGDLSEAEEFYFKAIQYNEKNENAYLNLGNLMRNSCSFDKALMYYVRTLEIKKDKREAQLALTQLLKEYLPPNSVDTKYRHPIIELDRAIREKIDVRQCLDPNQDVCGVLFKLLSEEKPEQSLTSVYTQIYCRNDTDLNCRRHKAVFSAHNVIPKFCFNCYKLQVSVSSLRDLLRLTFAFFNFSSDHGVTTKCFTELRSQVQEPYKGIVYCESLEQAHRLKQAMHVILVRYDLKASLRIKHGCTEFVEKYPDFEVDQKTSKVNMKYYEEWSEIEKRFDSQNFILPRLEPTASIPQFCLSDLLIVQNWIDYAKGLGDPSAKVFNTLETVNTEVHDIAVKRTKNRVRLA